MPSETEFRFWRGSSGAADLESAITAIVSDIKNERASDLVATPEIPEDFQVTVREESSGFEPVTTTIVLSFLGGAAGAAGKRMFDEVIWPRLRKRLGANALGGPADDA